MTERDDLPEWMRAEADAFERRRTLALFRSWACVFAGSVLFWLAIALTIWSH